MQVEIREKYELSGQYTPENVMAEYLDSSLAELDTRSVVERNMLQNAKCTFEEGNILCMQLIDTVIAQGKKDSLTDYLKGVYADRFGLPIEIRVMYKEPKESTLKYNDMRLQQEVRAVYSIRLRLYRSKKRKKSRKKKQSLGKKKKSGSGQGGKNSGDGKNSGSPAKGGFSKGSGFQKGGFRDKKVFVKSAKMDLDESGLIYGRPFDDEPIELSTVIGEMGEITFRGKVISFDTREIRNEKTIVMYAVTDFTDTIMVKMFVRNDTTCRCSG